MELKNLYTIKKIIELGSFQAASKYLSYAPSTITFQVKQVEEELGIILFNRNSKHISVTEEGYKCLKIIEAFEELENQLYTLKDDNALAGDLVIAIPETLITYKFQWILKEFRNRAPKVKLKIKVENCFTIYTMLKNEQIDLGIHYDVAITNDHLRCHKIADFPIVAITSPDDPIDLTIKNQIEKACFIYNDNKALYLKHFEEFLNANNIILENKMELCSIEAIKNAVISNLGFSVLPLFTVKNELEQGKLVEIKIDMAKNNLTAVYSYSTTRELKKSSQLFIELIDEFFNQ